MATRELTNGFANRFMMFWAERTKMLAFPRATRQEDVDALAARVLSTLKSEGHMRVMNRVFGSLFIAAGAFLSVFKRAG